MTSRAILAKIQGVPYPKNKVTGDKDAPKRWQQAVVDQTSHHPTVNGPVVLNVTFLLPPDKYPTDLPFGPDLDNLLKLTLDGLNKTIFKDVPGHDSCVVAMHVMKARVGSIEKAGAAITVLEVDAE